MPTIWLFFKVKKCLKKDGFMSIPEFNKFVLVCNTIKK